MRIGAARKGSPARESRTGSIDHLRYELTPQMRNYDMLLSRSLLPWQPHIMFFHPGGYRSAVVNTDLMGFRLGAHPNGQMAFSPLDICGSSEVNLLVGGSVVFGLGSSTDIKTISSQLSVRGTLDAAWLNLGGRGFTSAQELILFLLIRHRLPRVRHIVLLSGLNNLLLTAVTTSSGRYFGEFFFSGDFYEAMQRSNNDAVIRSSLLRTLFNRDRQMAAKTDRAPETALSIHDRIILAAEQVQRDLEHWRLLAHGLGATLSYAAHPLASWPRRRLHASEQSLFAALDEHAANAAGLLDAIRSAVVGHEYLDRLRTLCAATDVPYIDLMPALEASDAQGQWLFVDRAHFTDQGYGRIADTLHHFLHIHPEASP